MKKVLLSLIVLGAGEIQTSSHKQPASIVNTYNCPDCAASYFDVEKMVDHMLATQHGCRPTEENNQIPKNPRSKSRAGKAPAKSGKVGSVSPADSGVASAVSSGRSSAASAALSVDDFLEAADFYDFEENIHPSREFYAIAEAPNSLSSLADWQKFQLCRGLPLHFAINPVYHRLAQEVLAVYQPKTDKEFKRLLGLEVAKIERAKKQQQQMLVFTAQAEQQGAASAQSEDDGLDLSIFE